MYSHHCTCCKIFVDSPHILSCPHVKTIMFQNITTAGQFYPAQEKKILGYEVQPKERTMS